MAALLLALPGCQGDHAVSAPTPRRHGAGDFAATRWWRCLRDAPLTALIERAQIALPVGPQDGLSAAIASRYISLRGEQAALVLLAERENLDSRQVAMARLSLPAASASRRSVAAAEARLSATRADQLRARSAIAALRVRLAVLAGSALGRLDDLPDGPIPLPPASLIPRGPAALVADYRAAAARATDAQAAATSARAAAAQQILRAGAAGTLAPGEALDADRRALAALQAEERMRAAMAQAFVALAGSLAADRSPGDNDER